MGKAKRFNAYDEDVDKSRKQVEAFGRLRQIRSVGSSFRVQPYHPPTAQSGTSSSSGSSDLCPLITCENDLGTINGSQNIDWSVSNFHRCVADGNLTFTMTNLPAAGKYQQLVLEVKQDGTGGHTVTFLDTFLNSHVPAINEAANGVTTLAFYTYDDGTDRILGFNTAQIARHTMALSDETTALSTTSTTNPILSFRMPGAMVLTEVRTSLRTASTSGLVTVDIHESDTTVLSTLCSIDEGEKTSTTAATPHVVSDSSLADDAEIKIFLTAKGTNATGLKLTLLGYWT